MDTVSFGVVAFRPRFAGNLMQLVALAPLVGQSIGGATDELPKLLAVPTALFVGKDFGQTRLQAANGQQGQAKPGSLAEE